ncbi:MAG: DUF1836 domain-containing protein [Eubacteriales bacterium]|nr:DUF1836 domain-containing protein [Eubacteriales bacterium]
MKELADLTEKLSIERPEAWDRLPDMELYRDQVLSYMKRQQPLQSEETLLTGAMINNYIKIGLLPRANGKKYTREHLVYLTAVCSLKQILSVGKTDELLKLQSNILDSKSFYEEYLDIIDRVFNETLQQLDENGTKEELAATALQLALSSYAQKVTCEKLLDLLKEEKPPQKNKHNKKSKSKTE